MIKNYNINDYLKDNKELQKAVIQELLDDLKCAVMNVENLLETKQRLKSELTELKADIKELGSIIECKNGTIATLAKTRDNLKAENERLQKLTCFNCGEETLSPSGAEIYDKILVYQQTLQKIKEIVSKIIDGYIRPYGDYNQLKQILDLITKAEEE